MGTTATSEQTSDPVVLLREGGVQVMAQRLARPCTTPLGVLTDKRIIRRIQLARSPARYEGRVDDTHHHLVCRPCGRDRGRGLQYGTAPRVSSPPKEKFVEDFVAAWDKV